ncbi:putative signal transduction protein with CBS domains [Methanobacterium lacus]|uniref:Putative signal transduction protein with CBS domains n=1 Tax=Methanobacterium lacus (strain AL-21) TaxID=877455 RepID=F0TB51_METLA|nr:CBS domain-containing protein [Methanobacterium lacus]ADZ10197.1 putative signal transduction protein with CBS domains [Methanobacterium lacus]
MLTSVQKEILQSLINLYRNADASIKGEEIAEIMNRNPGTIRNQMQSLRSLGLVKGVPGPRGGYKPTIKAYHTLNIQASDNQSLVPIFRDGEKVKDITVSQIEFTSITHPGECEAAIKAVGNIKYLDLGDEIRIGPTPVNKLIVDGIVVGRDDMDNILLLDTTAIRSIPKKTVLEVASTDLIQLDPTDSIRNASKILSDRDIEGAPVVEDGHVIGILTLSDIIRAIGRGDEEQNVSEVMSSKNIITVKQDLMIADAIEIMNKNSIGRVIVVDDDASPIGIVTRTDLLDKIAGLR